jgi:hypothetical protein
MRMIIPTKETIARLIETQHAQKLLTELERDAESELDAQRVAALATIREARARAQREIPALQARVVNRLDNWRAVQKQLLSAEAEHRRAARALTLASDDETSAVTKAEAELIETAPDAVTEISRWLWDEYDRVRRSVETYPAGAIGNPALGQKKRTHVQSNYRSIKRYIDALQAARQEVHRLVLTEPSRAEIEARLVQIQRALPNNIEMEVVEGRH